MRKLRGKWYIRIFLENGKEQLLPTRTTDKKRAEAYKRKIEEREFYVKAKLEEDLIRCSTELFAAIDEFLSDCKTRLRPSTVYNYDVALGNLKDCWGNLDLRNITARHLATIREYLSARVNPTSTNIRLRAIRAFLNWLVSTDKIEKLPGKLSMVKIDDALPKFFTPDELEKILEAATDPKIKAAFKVLAGTGMRRSELYNCTLEDGYLHLRQTKGRRDRLVYLPPELVPDYLKAMDKPCIPNTLTHAFKKAIENASIEQKGRSLHSLRHTFALRTYAATRDIYMVKQLLGHSHVTITERYLKYPFEYLAKVFGDAAVIPPTPQNWAEAEQDKPPFQA